MTMNWRQRNYFAVQFNCKPDAVLEYGQLSLAQRLQANAMFSNRRMENYVYEVDHRGNVVARRNYTAAVGA